MRTQNAIQSDGVFTLQMQNIRLSQFENRGVHMGCWGMGITQSDEYCEVYERFMEEYDEGKAVADISKDILEEYLQEFEENDGILHDVYFALAKAQWMCGGISQIVYDRIRQIIDNGDNLAFLRELGASEADLKIRKMKLESFLHRISTPRGKTRKRLLTKNKDVTKTMLALPDIQIGGVFAFPYQNGYRFFAVARRGNLNDQPAVFVYAFRKMFSYIPELTALYQEYIIPLGYIYLNTLPNKEKCVMIGKMDEFLRLGSVIHSELITPVWAPSTYAVAEEKDLYEEYPLEFCLTLQETQERIRTLQQRHSMR